MKRLMRPTTGQLCALEAEFFTVRETLKGFRAISRKLARGGVVELRVCQTMPASAFLIVDKSMCYKYTYRENREGERLPIDIYWDSTMQEFADCEIQFEKSWNEAEAVDLDTLAAKTVSLPADFMDRHTEAR